MIKPLQPYLEKITRLSLRERILLCLAAATVAVFTAETVLLSPLERQRRSVAQVVAGQRAEIADLDTQLTELRATRQMDPETVAQARLREIRGRLHIVDSALQGVEKQLVAPERIPGLLEEMLKRHRSLQLVRLRTLPVVGLISTEPGKADEAAGDAADSPQEAPAARDAQAARGPQAAAVSSNIFKHGVEITLRGGYLDMLDYLAQLERYPLRMYWGEMKLDASESSVASVVLTVYTLSLDKAWLRISDI